MKLYEVISQDSGKVSLENIDEYIIDTGETFKSTAAFKKAARQNPEKYESKIFELHPDKIVRIKPTLQISLKFE